MEPGNKTMSNQAAQKAPSNHLVNDPLYEVRMQYEKESGSDVIRMIFSDDYNCPSDLDKYLGEKPKNLSHADEEFDVLGWWKFNSVRSSMTPRVVEALLCSQDWIREAKTTDAAGTINGAESIEAVEDLEKSLSRLNINMGELDGVYFNFVVSSNM
ncbi:hypothetical protein POM88_009186 [Heracleum sosnowskyi]|uniref:HAT C-terminal dimerisation domain-containing protein n=1 Tax=Heracleum sosnowskyi TaxID=360622 RepID=A0AAD8J8P1_9APIA|nr:hypothetical protein POM88_009186 [Heracleum sosnowskyi]